MTLGVCVECAWRLYDQSSRQRACVIDIKPAKQLADSSPAVLKVCQTPS